MNRREDCGLSKTADELGISQSITRRDFIGGVATSMTLLGTVGTACGESENHGTADTLPSEPYPPLRAGRAEMLAMPFEKIELETRPQLNRMLGATGFDALGDMLGITVNRWPHGYAHGYAYTYDTLGDPDLPNAEGPHVLVRAFGRIAKQASGAALNAAPL